MNDLVYRQAAIDAANRADYVGISVKYVKKVTDDVIKEIKALPSVEAVPKWIPVSEGMPKGQELVNVSCHDTSGDTSFDYTSSGWVTTNGEYWIVDNEINNYVVAWMPLPKPYKEENR